MTTLTELIALSPDSRDLSDDHAATHCPLSRRPLVEAADTWITSSDFPARALTPVTGTQAQSPVQPHETEIRIVTIERLSPPILRSGLTEHSKRCRTVVEDTVEAPVRL